MAARMWRKIDSAVSRSAGIPAVKLMYPSRYSSPSRIGRGNNCGLGHRRVLDQSALQREQADAVVRDLEDVVGPADERQIPVGVAHGDVAGAIDSGSQRRKAGILLLVAEHQPVGLKIEFDAYLALVALAVIGVQGTNAVAGIITAPSFIAASIVSHNGATLPSINRIRSPRLTPSARNPLAMRLERCDNSAKVKLAAPSLTMRKAVLSPVSPCASSASNQSRAQLNRSSAGQRKSRYAVR